MDEKLPRSAENGLHRPVPGPQHWDWRCLVCSEPVADHPSWWRRLLASVTSPADVWDGTGDFDGDAPDWASS